MQLPNGNYIGLVETSVDGPIPIGPWTGLYQILGYEADGETIEFPWIGDKIVIWDKNTKEVIFELTGKTELFVVKKCKVTLDETIDIDNPPEGLHELIKDRFLRNYKKSFVGL